MSRRLVERTSFLLADRWDRRGFLRSASFVGTALAVSPLRYLLRPVSAYAAVCSCSGQNCDCGAACCDGYTEFCCSITGENRCPPGTALGGWWKADGSGLCGAAARYYLDCNVVPPNSPCGCGCANGNCGLRKACCTRFRYGQCHREIAVMGPIMCRVVTCTPPWELDPTCSPTVLTDNATRFHDAPCLHAIPPPPPPPPTPTGWWMRDSLTPGAADVAVTYGRSDYRHLAGDWNGTGDDSIGIWEPATATFHLRNTNTPGPPDISIQYGLGTYVPLVGDWTGKGYDSIGIWDPATATFHLRNTNTPGPPDISVQYGSGGDTPVVGDWDGAGLDSIGVYRDGRWSLRRSNSPGPPHIAFDFGAPGYRPVVGDWNGGGADSVAVIGPEAPPPVPERPRTWLLRTSNTPGPPELVVSYGTNRYRAVVGDWDGDGVDGIGVWDPDHRTFSLRQTASEGPPQLSITTPTVGHLPVAGRWQPGTTDSVGWYGDGTWRLRLALGAPAELTIRYGVAGYLPVTGDWTGKGYDSIGVWEPWTGTFYLRNSNTPGPPEIVVQYGASGYAPVVGDWTGQGRDTIGVWDPATGTFYLRNSNTPGPPEVVVQYGSSSYLPIVGDWTGGGRHTIGVLA